MDIATHSYSVQRQQTAVVSAKEAERALVQLQGNLKSTRFLKSWPSEFPGLIAVEMDNGRVGYTDKTGRYFILGLVLDTATGAALDRQLEGVSTSLE